MSDEAVRPRLAEAIQGTAGLDDDLEGAVVLGWVVVVEWMAPTGNRWLSRIDGTASGEGCPEWQREGYLHNALFSPADFEDNDSEGDAA